jgi:hypothetical protein
MYSRFEYTFYKYVCSHSAYVFEIVVCLLQIQMYFPTQAAILGTKLNWLSHVAAISTQKLLQNYSHYIETFFIAVLHTSLAFMFSYCSYKSLM